MGTKNSGWWQKKRVLIWPIFELFSFIPTSRGRSSFQSSKVKVATLTSSKQICGELWHGASQQLSLLSRATKTSTMSTKSKKIRHKAKKRLTACQRASTTTTSLSSISFRTTCSGPLLLLRTRCLRIQMHRCFRSLSLSIVILLVYWGRLQRNVTIKI